MEPIHRQRIGLALGSGSARGWSHIGVIQALQDLGIEPDIVCGTSIGALVGAFYAAGRLPELDRWIRTLTRWDMIQFLDVNLVSRGGFVEGERLIRYFRGQLGDVLIEDLPKSFAAVATNLMSGQEVWFTDGPLLQAVRASISLPGFFSPVPYEQQYLVDGGLVNPVPVSVCRALGAHRVIAVNLNGELVGRHYRRPESQERNAGGKDAAAETKNNEPDPNGASFFKRLSSLADFAASLVASNRGSMDPSPGLFDVLAGSINIMQDRITRSRMAGDPPDVLLAPRLAHIELLEFYRAEEAIAEGRACVQRMAPALADFLDM